MTQSISATDSLVTPLHPLAIGGVGGSGTRLLANMLSVLEVYLGDKQNISHDNLWFTFLLKRPELLHDSEQLLAHIAIFTTLMTGKPLAPAQLQRIAQLALQPVAEFDAHWANDVAASMVSLTPPPSVGRHWGWKEPNTHIYLAQLLQALPNLRYIHVVRHGLDMAFSHNQLQLQLWGRHFLSAPPFAGPVASLNYWLVTQQRMLKLASAYPDRILLLNYDQLCLQPVLGVQTLLDFLAFPVIEEVKQRLLAMPRVPATQERYKSQDLGLFSRAALDQVEAFGFSI